jgi:two-component system, OmpR family, response regulator MtrA
MPKVLVIEDDDDVRKIVCRMLRSAGHEVIETSQGAAGLAALQRDSPDLVLTDLIMPGSDGIETIAKIREVSGLPIIAMSGAQQGERYAPLLDAQMMGADLTIRKPFTVERLIAAVDELLQGDQGAA